MEGMGEGKLNFPLLKSVKPQKGPLGQSVSTYFVTDSLNRNLGTVALLAQVKSDNFLWLQYSPDHFYEGS